MNHQNLLTQCYIDKCKENNLPIEEHGLKAYNQCDDMIIWIEEQKNQNLYKMALTMNGMMIPLEKAKTLATLEELPEGYYDEIIDGEYMYEAKLLCDIFRVEIINRLIDEEDNIITLKWKLRRLEKFYKLGIEEYKKQYKI
jgi:hypothetical protein